jgi:hypothetical protein
MTKDNLFSAVVTFSLMAGATIAFGADLVHSGHAPTAAQIATLPAVTIVGKRIAASDCITLPTVTVVGRRVAATRVAASNETVEQRVE